MIPETAPIRGRKKEIMSADPRGFLIVGVLCLLVSPNHARSEEAVEPSGRKHRGRLVHAQGAWFFRDEQERSIPLKNLAHVRFDPKTTVLPGVPLTHTLLLPGDQRVTGTLLYVDEKSVAFASSWGGRLTLNREQVVGVGVADGWLPLLYDDLETSLKAWNIEGSAELDLQRAFFGKSSLRLDPRGKRLERSWPAFTDGRVSWFFFQGESKKLAPRWTVELLTSAGGAVPGVEIDGAGVRCIKAGEQFGMLEPTGRWRMLVIERRDDVVRFHVDNRCLGQTRLPRETRITGMRWTVDRDDVKAAGSIWLDELIVTRRQKALPMPRSDADQDWLWLTQGEQLFGRIVSADARVVTLDATFGKRTLAWSQVRGIGFAAPKPRTRVDDVEVEYLPGAGFSSDCLRVKLLRWNESKLFLQHALLGEIAIERDRLVRVHFAVK